MIFGVIRRGLGPYLWPAVLAALVASHGLVAVRAYSGGRDAADARHAAAKARLQAGLFAAGEDLSRRAAELEATRSEAAALAREIENEAMRDPDGNRPGIGPDGWMRLKRRWGSP